MRRLAVLTSDFSLYHDLVRYLREHSVAFTSLAFGEQPGPDVGALVTSWRDVLRPDLPSELPVVAVPVDAQGREDIAAAVLQAQRILEGIPGYREVVVGVDPGKRPGLAVLGDGRLLDTAQVFDAKAVGPRTRKFLELYPADRYVVRLGHGAPRERDAILRDLGQLDRRDLLVQLVDETGTTPPPGQRVGLPPDVAAAVEIARTPGRPPPRARGYVSAGQIREIQRESRELSGGKFTISRDQARRVAREELSLADAIEEERGLRRRRNRSSIPSRSKG